MPILKTTARPGALKSFLAAAAVAWGTATATKQVADANEELDHLQARLTDSRAALDDINRQWREMTNQPYYATVEKVREAITAGAHDDLVRARWVEIAGD